jgi:hypothetical protein
MKNFGGILVLISVAYFASLSEAQYSQADNYRPGFFQQNPCVSKQTCSKCLQTPNCAWCMKEVRRKKNINYTLNVNLLTVNQDWKFHAEMFKGKQDSFCAIYVVYRRRYQSCTPHVLQNRLMLWHTRVCFSLFDRSTCSKRSKESLCRQTFFLPFVQILEYFIILLSIS